MNYELHVVRIRSSNYNMLLATLNEALFYASILAHIYIFHHHLPLQHNLKNTPLDYFADIALLTILCAIRLYSKYKWLTTLLAFILSLTWRRIKAAALKGGWKSSSEERHASRHGSVASREEDITHSADIHRVFGNSRRVVRREEDEDDDMDDEVWQSRQRRKHLEAVVKEVRQREVGVPVGLVQRAREMVREGKVFV